VPCGQLALLLVLHACFSRRVKGPYGCLGTTRQVARWRLYPALSVYHSKVTRIVDQSLKKLG
jgi:hypothetical protein